MVQVSAPFVLLFSESVWRHARVLLVGTILTAGRTTVTVALRARDGFGPKRAVPSLPSRPQPRQVLGAGALLGLFSLVSRRSCIGERRKPRVPFSPGGLLAQSSPDLLRGVDASGARGAVGAEDFFYGSSGKKTVKVPRRALVERLTQRLCYVA
jgi:hypothetical protein